MNIVLPELPDEMIFDKSDYLKLFIKEHPIQHKVAETFNIDLENVFAPPQPYMGALHEAKLVYKKGTGKYGKGYAEGSYEVSKEDPWFWSHFIGDPVMPGTQGADAFLQLGFSWGSFSGHVPGLPRALSGSYVFDGQVLPRVKKIFYRADIKNFFKKKKLIIFDGYQAIDTPDNIITRYGETKGGWFMRDELGISPMDKQSEEYNPNWEKAKSEILSHVERAEKYYDKHSKDRHG